MTSGIRISVLTPAFNASQHIEDLIHSVEQQSYSAFEHIIVDDGSTDDTFEIIRRYRSVKAITRPNRGQYATQNELLDLAEGDVVVLISADDLFANRHAFRAVADEFAGNLTVDVVVGRTPRKFEGDDPYIARPDVPLWLGCRTVASCLSIKHCSVFVRRSVIEAHGAYFDESYRMAGDWDWLIRVLGVARRVKTVRADLGTWRIHPTQTSRVSSDIGQQEKERLLAAVGSSVWVHRNLKRLYDGYSRAQLFWAISQVHGFRAACRRAASFAVRRTA